MSWFRRSPKKAFGGFKNAPPVQEKEPPKPATSKPDAKKTAPKAD